MAIVAAAFVCHDGTRVRRGVIATMGEAGAQLDRIRHLTGESDELAPDGLYSAVVALIVKGGRTVEIHPLADPLGHRI